MNFFDTPVCVSICRGKTWMADKGAVTIKDGVIRLRTDSASWVRIDWAVDFEKDAMVLADAWERTYGDVGWKPIGQPAFSPWYFTVREKEKIRCFGVKTQPNALCSWTYTANCICLLLDVRCGCLDTLFDGREAELATVVKLEKTGPVFDVMHEFCKMMCDKPVLPAQPIYGGDEWYTNYGKNSFSKVMDHARIIAQCAEGLKNRPIQVVDAGWTLCHNWYLNDEYIGGPHRYCNAQFGDMKALADAMKEIGVRPAIWCRPMETLENVPDGAFTRRIRNIKNLDPSHPWARELMINDIKLFGQWGYDVVKHDFAGIDTFGTYAFEWSQSACEGEWAFYDRSRTSAEITLDYYRDTAVAAGNMTINACNTLSHLSAGIFAGYRIGDDISGHDFARTLKMGVNAMAVRGCQHNAFYAADPDCVGITDEIKWEENKQWLELLKYSGMTTIVSVQKEMYTTEVRDAVTEAFALASEPHEVARPIGWDEKTLTPNRWMTFDGEKEFKWN